MKLSIVDLAQIPPGGSAVAAFDQSVALARAAERAGYHRYWLAEHHGIGPAVASCCPEALIARVAAATTSIRVGAGTVLMNYSRPLRIAETYRSLHAMFPGRIDVGLGQAQAPPVVDGALRGSAALGTGGDGELFGSPGGGPLDSIRAWLAHEDDVAEVLAWLDDRFAPGDPRAQVRLAPGVAGGPEPWLLGSSLSSAALAGRLGLRYGYAAFFNPAIAVAACRSYRACFEPSPGSGGVARPTTMLGVNVCCAESNAEADRLRASVELFYRDGAGGPDRRPLVGPARAVAELGGPPAPTLPGARTWAPHLSGDPERVRALIEECVAETGADEVVIQDLIAEPDDRIRSYELIAEAFELASTVTSGA